jgi:hypothetical protein
LCQKATAHRKKKDRRCGGFSEIISGVLIRRPGVQLLFASRASHSMKTGRLYCYRGWKIANETERVQCEPQATKENPEIDYCHEPKAKWIFIFLKRPAATANTSSAPRIEKRPPHKQSE